MDDNKPDIIRQLRKQKLIGKYTKEVKDMNKTERGYWNEK